MHLLKCRCPNAIQILVALQLDKLQAEIRKLRCSWNWAVFKPSSFKISRCNPNISLHRVSKFRDAIQILVYIATRQTTGWNSQAQNAAEIELHWTSEFQCEFCRDAMQIWASEFEHVASWIFATELDRLISGIPSRDIIESSCLYQKACAQKNRVLVYVGWNTKY